MEQTLQLLVKIAKPVQKLKNAKQMNVNEFLEKTDGSDGFEFASPVHYATAKGIIAAFLDRTFLQIQ